MAMAWKLQKGAIASLVSGCAVLLSWGAQAQRTPAPSVSVSLEKEVITRHEPVVLVFTVGNSASQAQSGDAVFDPGYDYKNVHVTVTAPDGRVRQRPRPAEWTEGTKFSEAVHVPPGAAAVCSIVLNDWFEFDRVGTYQIDLSVSPIRGSSPAEMQVPETSLTLTVLPRDGASLASACADLVITLRDSKSFAARRTAATALAKIDDPAAVPSLAEALKQRDFRPLLIEALAHLNTPDAVKALLAASRSSDEETSRLAHDALVGLGETGPTQ